MHHVTTFVTVKESPHGYLFIHNVCNVITQDFLHLAIATHCEYNNWG